jgi:hypothetical protein
MADNFGSGSFFQSRGKTEETSPKNAFFTPSGSLEEHLPTVGDLVVVKCDLQFASAGYTFPQSYFLPHVLKEHFVMVDIIDHQRRRVDEETKYIPVLTLNVYLDIEGMLELTEEDYEESYADTKIWDKRERGGLRLRDYVCKRSSLFKASGDGHLAFQENVEFYTIAWRENDVITGVPGIIEARKEKHWFFNSWNNNIYRGVNDLQKESYVKFPLVGLVGTLLDTRIVTHGLTADGRYVAGEDFKTIFYKVLFRDRIPVWVDQPVWKCPEPLALPILLPIP